MSEEEYETDFIQPKKTVGKAESIELVIKIPEKDWEFIKAADGCRWSRAILEGVINGTPLPKGHGTLIDSDKLIDKWKKATVRGRTEFDQVIMCEPTIIPAESEE